MKLNNFELKINEGKEVHGGYVELEHNSCYTITLTNGSANNADVELEIDGKSVGVFRVDNFSRVVLERPTNSQKKFTFFMNNSKEFFAASLQKVNTEDLGLIKATFKPGKLIKTKSRNEFPPIACNETFTNLKSSGRSGGTGLTGHSNQSFTEVENLNYTGDTVVIYLRLVQGNKIEELKPTVKAQTEIPKPL